MFAILLLIATILIVYIYNFLNQKYSYWSSRGIVGPKPFFIFGNLTQNILKRKTTGQIAIEVYK